MVVCSRNRVVSTSSVQPAAAVLLWRTLVRGTDLIDVTASWSRPDLVTLHVAGDVCVVTAPVLRLALDGAIDAGARVVIVDLASTSLLTAAGVTQLVWAM